MPRKRVSPMAMLIVAFGTLLFLDGQCNGNQVRICSWNLERFGDSLVRDNNLMDGIGDIVKICEVVLLQEMFIHQVDDFVEKINTRTNLVWHSLQSKYNSPFGTAEETQLILYRDPVKVEDKGYVEFIKDQLQKNPGEETKFFRRPPWKVNIMDEVSGGSILLIGHHAMPIGAFGEIERLLTKLQGEKEAILIAGDLNADENYVSLKEIESLKNNFNNFVWTSCGLNTYSTPTDKCYDRFISNDHRIQFKDFEVIPFPKSLKKTVKGTNRKRRISDHYMIRIIWDSSPSNNSPGPSTGGNRQNSPGPSTGGKRKGKNGGTDTNPPKFNKQN